MCPMPDGGRDPDDRSPLDSADRSRDDGALAPDELDIEDEENVVSLDPGRYVIGTDERPNVPDGNASPDGSQSDDDAAESAPDEESADDGRGRQSTAPADSGAVKRRLEDDLDSASSRYGFHVTAKADDAISHQQMFSDDVGTVFDGLLRWYAQQLTTETAVEDVLGILLTESNVRVRYSPSCLQAILETYDLSPDDSIADFFEAVQDDRGMVFPPENVE
ncbi:hypothetical protein M0R88_18305 [Halorussus gelatinilyticus]|uniref:Flagella cluster protein n=1 Tax=Halorussus gelatinilyticus TaxID=2937524 RepID=A0A8U0IJH6_9EURY|nr:hypothetical protein [Halorussus gelatinilyticus]UPW00442.1 hypothetical protein M0R88_18305 [Halorussus gelatinilyticus]